MDVTSAKIKFRNDEDLKQQIKDKRFNLTCEDVVDIFKDIITMKFGKDEVSTFEFFKSSQQHLRINDKKTGTNFTASCHSRSGQPGRYNPSEINTLLRMLTESIRFREDEQMKKLSNTQKWVKVAKWSKVDDEEIHPDLVREIEAAKKKKKTKNHGGLDDWFKKEKWVDVSRPKKGGGFEACGRGDTTKGKKPVCTPANKAKNLTDKERKNRIRQKRNKEKEPNPDKKPNVTKYSPGAGGKSNVSDNHNIRFIGSMIPLSDLKPKQSKFVKIALLGEEEEIPTTDISGMFTEKDNKVTSLTEQIQEKAFTELAEILSHNMGLNEPSGNIIHSIKFYENAVQEEMTEEEYLKFIKHKVAVIRNMHKKAIEDKDSKMHEITYKMHQRSVNPFNYSEVADIVREVISK